MTPMHLFLHFEFHSLFLSFFLPLTATNFVHKVAVEGLQMLSLLETMALVKIIYSIDPIYKICL